MIYPLSLWNSILTNYVCSICPDSTIRLQQFILVPIDQTWLTEQDHHLLVYCYTIHLHKHDILSLLSFHFIFIHYLLHGLFVKSLHSRMNIALLLWWIIFERMCLLLLSKLLSIKAVFSLVLLTSDRDVALDLICFHTFVPLKESQIRPGTVMGLKNNLPNFASAYDTHTRVASNDGTLRSRYLTGLLLRDAFSRESCMYMNNRCV